MDDNPNKVAPEFNWIRERSSCTLSKIFSTLRTQVEEDVKTRNAQRLKNAQYEFLMKEDVGEFTVVLKAEEIEQSVTFKLSDHLILVQNEEGNPNFEITLVFDDEGQCRLNVNSEQRKFWQVRRMALEELFFSAL